MVARFFVFGLLGLFAFVFVYSAWHEYRRFKRDGGSTYGLHYDEETNTTHVGALPDEDPGYDPEDFVPDELEQREAEAEAEAEAEDAAAASQDPEQDKT